MATVEGFSVVAFLLVWIMVSIVNWYGVRKKNCWWRMSCQNDFFGLCIEKGWVKFSTKLSPKFVNYAQWQKFIKLPFWNFWNDGMKSAEMPRKAIYSRFDGFLSFTHKKNTYETQKALKMAFLPVWARARTRYES